MNAIALHGLVAQRILLADDDTDKASPIGLFLVLILCIAVYFLYRSMSRHLRKVPSSFDPLPDSTDPEHPEAAAPIEDGESSSEPSASPDEPGSARP